MEEGGGNPSSSSKPEAKANPPINAYERKRPKVKPAPKKFKAMPRKPDDKKPDDKKPDDKKPDEKKPEAKAMPAKKRRIFGMDEKGKVHEVTW